MPKIDGIIKTNMRNSKGLGQVSPRADNIPRPLIDALGFRECRVCSIKPGSPVLCPSCLHNRQEIHYLHYLQNHIVDLEAKLAMRNVNAG